MDSKTTLAKIFPFKLLNNFDLFYKYSAALFKYEISNGWGIKSFVCLFAGSLRSEPGEMDGS